MDIIINADDFGLSSGVNEGIIDTHLNGVVTRTTLLMNGHAVEEAVRLAKNHPSLKVGIHLTFTFGRPLNQKATSELTNADGKFKFSSIETPLSQLEIRQIKNEWQSQIEAFRQTGLELDHIDSHHHVHGWTDLKKVILELGTLYHVPIRYTKTIKDHPEHTLTEYAWLNFYEDGVDHHLFEYLTDLPYPTVEVMTHPAVIDEKLKTVSSYVSYREIERQLLKTMVPTKNVNLI
ncbi:carbohydrate deacetylase [Marinilactibacillus psychrotolerans]|uniref:Carbohydrate deacetylase n=1 Tax=Marinilactibacillus psychrotolerans TaxID=191770 RepID=A0A5R9BWG9_9LACT|nr:carbohydrate deacetylase [Marinilactibacillus psychrotolerans]TLQ04232.1 carbohydrate deacetylase [Marinilactibacillus psychrotolerans]